MGTRSLVRFTQQKSWRPNGKSARAMDLGFNLVGSTRALTARPKEPPKALSLIHI